MLLEKVLRAPGVIPITDTYALLRIFISSVAYLLQFWAPLAVAPTVERYIRDAMGDDERFGPPTKKPRLLTELEHNPTTFREINKPYAGTPACPESQSEPPESAETLPENECDGLSVTLRAKGAKQLVLSHISPGRQHTTGNAAGSSRAKGTRGKSTKSKGKGRQKASRKGNKRNPKKRPRNDSSDSDGGSWDGDSDSDDGDDPGAGDPAGGAAAAPGRLFACHWYVFDPIRHYRCAGKYHLKTFKAVKEHAGRCHVLPTFYCSVCWTRFKSSAELTRHLKPRECTEISGPEEIYLDELDLLETDPRQTDEERWLEIWDKVFKGHRRPRSVYLEDGIAEPAKLLLEWNQASIRKAIASMLQHNGIAPDGAEAEGFLQGVLDTAFKVPSGPLRIRKMPPSQPTHSDAGTGASDEPAPQPRAQRTSGLGVRRSSENLLHPLPDNSQSGSSNHLLLHTGAEVRQHPNFYTAPPGPGFEGIHTGLAPNTLTSVSPGYPSPSLAFADYDGHSGATGGGLDYQRVYFQQGPGVMLSEANLDDIYETNPRPSAPSNGD